MKSYGKRKGIPFFVKIVVALILGISALTALQ